MIVVRKKDVYEDEVMNQWYRMDVINSGYKQYFNVCEQYANTKAALIKDKESLKVQ